MQARRLIITLGREGWAQSTKGVALALNKSPDTGASIQREGVKQRLDDAAFASSYELLDETLIGEGQ